MSAKITWRQAADLPRKVAGQVFAAGEKARHRTAQRYVVHLRRLADALGITYQGTYKRGFVARGPVVENDAPHAGVIEDGARPHPVSMEGQQAIKEWAMRKLGLPENEARSVAFLVARKIKEKGQEAKHVMRDSLPAAVAFLGRELERAFSEIR